MSAQTEPITVALDHLLTQDRFEAPYVRAANSALDELLTENETLRAALEPLAAQAQDILDVLASGSEPWAATGYGYEHMGDYTRDVKPLCEALVALASGDTDTQESK
jgi:hypothetical protein